MEGLLLLIPCQLHSASSVPGCAIVETWQGVASRELVLRRVLWSPPPRTDAGHPRRPDTALQQTRCWEGRSGGARLLFQQEWSEGKA